MISLGVNRWQDRVIYTDKTTNQKYTLQGRRMLRNDIPPTTFNEVPLQLKQRRYIT